MEDLPQYPEWKHAVVKFLAEDPKPGFVITERWKQEHFGIYPPLRGSLEQLKDYQLKMLTAFDGFSRILTEDYQIHLQSDRKGGHFVLAPKEQTSAAMHECNRGIRKAFSKSKFKLDNVALTELSSEERKEHTDAQVRLAMSASMFKKVRRIALS